jgi:two-component system KDP operon response regulator KdpE
LPLERGARLVVEDEAPIRRFLRSALEAEGHYVSEAATAREGIRLAALEQPAAIILDLGLPDTDGLAVLREVRAWSQVPVLSCCRYARRRPQRSPP